ncbi:hypothetical protein GA150_29045 [Bacteroides xylanisolvens]|uniref:hypothetical protein n=1 Tax=Bacteroides xylanisolvens TaxID=371601 RepID=UPI00125FA49C|nr:hypothetical protein [Bacteroides xylanisolvens]KAB6377388.1 hypothetical protein GA150_29045 [Bacteroides xylanisolvens]
MVEYCVYWLENGEPMHEVFSSRAKQNQPTGGRIGNGFLWRVHVCVQNVCILLKYSYLCAEFKSKQIWKHYQ